MSKISLSQLESFLKEQCDNLRKTLDAAEYKDYIIAMIFLKRANDEFYQKQKQYKKKLEKEHKELTQEEINEEIEIKNTNIYPFFVPVLSRWNIEELPESLRKSMEKQKADSAKIIASDKADKFQKEEASKKLQEAQMYLEFKGISKLSEADNVGTALTIALRQLEAENNQILDGVLSTTKFDTTNSKGNRILPDADLVTMIQAFGNYTFTDDQFEFPDLLGAAYEFLIKYFAESAGKKGGEFYTPHPVVELMAKILKPEPDFMICDPTVGSGGLLIDMKNYVDNRYGIDASRNLTLHGQEVKDGTYRMCRMNMIFHGIKNANIQQGDTLLEPKLLDNGQLIKYDIVVANPPFSQNYSTGKMKFKERFQYWMKEKKQADFMFVQHMISVLKDDGRLAVIMPQGVLFRGGEEQKMRKFLITGTSDTKEPNGNCILEAVIGLPGKLFYGTPLAACLLIINKKNAKIRKDVLFINADREFGEGSNQNFLRPEDIEKISYVYEHRMELSKYSKLISQTKLESEVFNCNISRYVNNNPDPEPQDVYAHLHGGIPNTEIASFTERFACYPKIEKALFEKIDNRYSKFSSVIHSVDDIKEYLKNNESYKKTRNEYESLLSNYWLEGKALLKGLSGSNNVYEFANEMTEKFINKMQSKNNPVLDDFQCRGAFADYISNLRSDFKSVAASCWNAELIPEEEILRDQYPEVLSELNKNLERKEELQGLFDEVNSLEDDEWDIDSYEVLPKDEYTKRKNEIKTIKSEIDQLNKQIRNNTKRIKAYQKSSDSDKAERIAEIEELNNSFEAQIVPLQKNRELLLSEISKHENLAEELKECNATIKQITSRKYILVKQAKEKITPEEAEKLICARWFITLENTINTYLDNHILSLQKDLEALYKKYENTLGTLISNREKSANSLADFLKELGYE